MGKGTILTGGEAGQYSVEVELDTSRMQTAIDKLTARISSIESLIAAETNDRKKSYYTLIKASLEKQKAYLIANQPENPVASVWCADLTEDLSGEVGLVEIPGERTYQNIQPGYEGNAAYAGARDGKLAPILNLSTAESLYNYAMLPGWQKWMPTYRYGTISNIDTDADTCDVTLDAAISSQQGLDVNYKSSLSDVPIEYMDCNCAAFEVDDKVVVQFSSIKTQSTANWDNPKVIGFKNNPKPCWRRYVEVEISLSGGSAAIAMVWDSITDSAYMSARLTTYMEYVAWKNSKSDWGSDLGVSGQDYGNPFYRPTDPETGHVLPGETYEQDNPHPLVPFEEQPDRWRAWYVYLPEPPEGPGGAYAASDDKVSALKKDMLYSKKMTSYATSDIYEGLGESVVRLGYRVRKYIYYTSGYPEEGRTDEWHLDFIDHFGVIEVWDHPSKLSFPYLGEYFSKFEAKEAPYVRGEETYSWMMMSLVAFVFDSHNHREDPPLRKVIVSAQAKSLPPKTKKIDYNFIGAGKSTNMSDAISAAIEMTYTANGLGDDSILEPIFSLRLY